MAMDKVKIGINGFGRIGRLIARVVLQRDDVEFVAVNDPIIPAEIMGHMFKYETIHGQGKHYDVTLKDSKTLLFGEKEVTAFEIRNPEEIPWSETGAEFVIDTTILNGEKAAGHLMGCVQNVIIPSPRKDAPVSDVGVTGHEHKPKLNILSYDQDFQDRLAIVENLVSTVHTIMDTEKTVAESSGKDEGVGKTASFNIFPRIAGAAKAVGKSLPVLGGKFSGMAFRFPKVDVSDVDLIVGLDKPSTYDDMEKGIIREDSERKLKGILIYTEDDVDSAGSSARLIGTIAKVARLATMAWFTCARVVDLIAHITKFIEEVKSHI